MVDYQGRIHAELEQIQQAIAKLPSGSLTTLSELELSGVGGIFQSIYNGIENILKQLLPASRFPKVTSGTRNFCVRRFSMILSPRKQWIAWFLI